MSNLRIARIRGVCSQDFQMGILNRGEGGGGNFLKSIKNPSKGKYFQPGGGEDEFSSPPLAARLSRIE